MPRPPQSYHSKVGTKPKKGKSSPPRTTERARLMGIYNKMLQKIYAIMGKQTTTSLELETAMRRFGLSPCEVGRLSVYHNRQKSGNGPKYGIYNTMDEAPGQHWFCSYDGHKYDPLGDDKSDTQEQPSDADDCGQRCIAYLLMCKKKGGHIMM